MPASQASFTESPASPPLDWRLALVLWLLGLPGVVALTWNVVPQWLAFLDWSHSLASWRVVMAGLLSLLTAVSVLVGLRLGQSACLGAPLLAACMAGKSPWRAIRFLSLPAIAGGVAGAAWLVTLAVAWPESLSVVDPVYGMALLPKLLYGAITEELLLRFGGMSLVMWVLWRLFGRTTSWPSWRLGCWAVGITAVVLGTVPIAMAWSLVGTMPHTVVLQLLLCEIVFGAMVGFLYWRYGLESAMLAHVVAYLLSHGLV
jgi:hypothetical protein